MKKILSLIISTILLLSLVSCTVETVSGNNKETEPIQSEAQDPVESSSNNAGNNESEPNRTPDETNDEPEKNEMIFEETVAVDNDECTIKITDIYDDIIWGYTLKVQLENKSADKTYMYSLESAAVNGVQCTTIFATEVAPGKKANDKIIFSDNMLEENDITEYTDIELTFRVYDSNDWMADAVAKETVHIYPYGEEKAVKFERLPKETDTVIVDNEYVKVVVIGCELGDIWGYTVDLFIINKTDKDVMFSTEEESVNGFMIDPFYATTVSPHKCAFDSITWSNSSLEENEITDVETLEFVLRAYNLDNILGEDFANEVITLNP